VQRDHGYAFKKSMSHADEMRAACRTNEFLFSHALRRGILETGTRKLGRQDHRLSWPKIATPLQR
jgi:hypothetical protein